MIPAGPIEYLDLLLEEALARGRAYRNVGDRAEARRCYIIASQTRTALQRTARRYTWGGDRTGDADTTRADGSGVLREVDGPGGDGPTPGGLDAGTQPLLAARDQMS